MSINAQSMKGMTLELRKVAGGEWEKKLPWYTTGAGALLGGAAGGAMASKHKLLGQLAGGLVGTGVGLEGGEAIGREIDKRQQGRKKPTPNSEPGDDEPDMSIQPVPGPAPPMRKAAASPASLEEAVQKVKQLGLTAPAKKKLSPEHMKAVAAAAHEKGQFVTFPKEAAFDDPKKPSTAKVLGSSLLGMGAGMGLGYGALKGVDALSKARGGKGVPPGMAQAAMPFVGGAVGMAAPLLHYATLERMREEHARKQQMAQEAPGGGQGS